MRNNYSFSVALLKLKNACVRTIKGKETSKECLIIPLDDARLYVGRDNQTGKITSVGLDLVAFENGSYNDTTHEFIAQLDQYGNSHAVKQSFSQEVLSSMTDDERKSLPFLANFRPLEKKSADAQPAPVIEVDDEDLPF